MTTKAKKDPVSAPRRIIKRNGNEVPFDENRIVKALEKAGRASGEFETGEARALTYQVMKVIGHRYQDPSLPDVEAIQDICEQVLISANHFATARAYIVYREQHHKLRADKRTLVDVAASINEYLDGSDWRVKANANQGYSLGGLILNTSGKMI
ncbi:MAG: ribonucleoside triphosphate reductase, partial [Gammaproteobacteria bacterium]|nr:ribonucleoside triphosphate reductase [Gammaproteobacteria bacterium]